MLGWPFLGCSISGLLVHYGTAEACYTWDNLPWQPVCVVTGQVLMWHLCLPQSTVKLEGASAKSGLESTLVLELLFAELSAGLVLDQTVI